MTYKAIHKEKNTHRSVGKFQTWEIRLVLGLYCKKSILGLPCLLSYQTKYTRIYYVTINNASSCIINSLQNVVTYAFLMVHGYEFCALSFLIKKIFFTGFDIKNLWEGYLQLCYFFLNESLLHQKPIFLTFRIMINLTKTPAQFIIITPKPR